MEEPCAGKLLAQICGEAVAVKLIAFNDLV
jgi:hypothetical protein